MYHKIFWYDFAVRALTMLRIDERIVRDDENVVTGDRQIEFDRGDTHFERILKGGQGIFWSHGAGATMAFDIERVRADADEKTQKTFHGVCLAKTDDSDVTG